MIGFDLNINGKTFGEAAARLHSEKGMKEPLSRVFCRVELISASCLNMAPVSAGFFFLFVNVIAEIFVTWSLLRTSRI